MFSFPFQSSSRVTMQRDLCLGFVGWLVFAGAVSAQVQTSNVWHTAGAPAATSSDGIATCDEQRNAWPAVPQAPTSPSLSWNQPAEPSAQRADLFAAQDQLSRSSYELQDLQAQRDQAKNQTEAQRLQKQVDLLQKQVQVLENMVRLLADQLKKQPAAGAPSEVIQTQVATLEAPPSRLLGAMTRLPTLSTTSPSTSTRWNAMDPSSLLLSRGSSCQAAPTRLLSASMAPGSRLQQNRPPARGILLRRVYAGLLAETQRLDLVGSRNCRQLRRLDSAGSFAQADFFVTDWLTIIAGRFVAPIGWFNERLNNPWINKLPGDAPGSGPLLWEQVLPAFSMLGVQAQGSFYLGCSPFKMEYNAYITNGLNLEPATAGAPTIDELANLENMEDTFTFITNEKAVGGRVGLWWPEMGMEVGFSAMYNGDYVAGGFEDSISLCAVDANYHKGDWDWRFEYGAMDQQAHSFAGTPGLLGNNIRREGFYTQLAYRPRDIPNKYLQNVEAVYRYSYVNFHGIDPTALDLSTYSTPVDVPVRRQQNEIGLDYWFYPRMVLKCAYQINDEPGFHLHDNQFITELAWGW